MVDGSHVGCLNARFKDGAVRVPYAQGFERKMIKIRGRVLSKEEVLRQNLLPDWPESITYQKERAKRQLQKAHELVQQAALRHAVVRRRWVGEGGTRVGGGRGAGTLAAEAHLLVGQRAEVGDLRLGFLVAYCCGCQRWLVEV